MTYKEFIGAIQLIFPKSKFTETTCYDSTILKIDTSYVKINFTDSNKKRMQEIVIYPSYIDRFITGKNIQFKTYIHTLSYLVDNPSGN